MPVINVSSLKFTEACLPPPPPKKNIQSKLIHFVSTSLACASPVKSSIFLKCSTNWNTIWELTQWALKKSLSITLWITVIALWIYKEALVAGTMITITMTNLKIPNKLIHYNTIANLPSNYYHNTDNTCINNLHACNIVISLIIQQLGI